MMSELTLYDMTAELWALMEACNSVDDLTPEESESLLQNAITGYIGQDMVASKVDNYCRFIKELDDTTSLDEEIERLRGRKKARENMAARLKAGLLQFLEVSGRESVQGAFMKASLSTTKATHIADEAMIPPQYWEPQPPKLLKSEILRDLKQGKEVPGAAIELRKWLRMQ